MSHENMNSSTIPVEKLEETTEVEVQRDDAEVHGSNQGTNKRGRECVTTSDSCEQSVVADEPQSIVDISSDISLGDNNSPVEIQLTDNVNSTTSTCLTDGSCEPTAKRRRQSRIVEESQANETVVRFADTPTEYISCKKNGSIIYLPHPEWFTSTKYLASLGADQLEHVKIYLDTDNLVWKTSSSYGTSPHQPYITRKKNTNRIECLQFGKDNDTILLQAIKQDAIGVALSIIRIEANTTSAWMAKPEVSIFDIPNRLGITPIILAAQKGKLKVVRELVLYGANVFMETKNGGTAILQAARYGHTYIIECILQRYNFCSTYINELVNLTKVKSKKTTPLAIAAQEGHTSTVQLLLRYNADMDCCTSNNMTPLMIAAHRGHADICELLIKKGARKDKQLKEDLTALMYACKRGHVDTVRVLVAGGCNLHMTDARNRTAALIIQRRVVLAELNRARDQHVEENVDVNDLEALRIKNQTLLHLLDPTTQLLLMQKEFRKDRTFEIIRHHTLLHQNRASIRPDDEIFGIRRNLFDEIAIGDPFHAVASPMVPKQSEFFLNVIETYGFTLSPSRSFYDGKQALKNAMKLPASLLQMIALFLPQADSWTDRLIKLPCTAVQSPNKAIIDALDIIDEILEDCGLLYAFQRAHIPIPLSTSDLRVSWKDWKKKATTTMVGKYDAGRGSLPLRVPQTFATNTNKPLNVDAPTIYELRREVGYLQLLAKYESDIGPILLVRHHFWADLFFHLVNIADVASTCRRLGCGPFYEQIREIALNNNNSTTPVQLVQFDIDTANDIIRVAFHLYQFWNYQQDQPKTWVECN